MNLTSTDQEKPSSRQTGNPSELRALARLCAGTLVLLIAVVFAASGAKPTLRITVIPPFDAKGGPDTSATIQGEVSGVKFSDYRVVIYTRTNQWYVQPEVGGEFTTINNQGGWQNVIHTGTRYAALLVKKPSGPGDFQPKPSTSILPDEGTDPNVIASAQAEGKR
jgi:hypothetical protein